MEVEGMGAFVGRLGRVVLTYVLIYQQIFLSFAAAGGGLQVIQADLDVLTRCSGPTKSLREPAGLFSAMPVEVKEAFKTCHVVLRAEGDKVQALWRRGTTFYAFQHPELSSCVRLHQEKGKTLLYVKSLLSGKEYQDFVIGLESSEGILIEDSLQLKNLIVHAPVVLNRAMGFLQEKLTGMDVERLDIYGQFKMEGGSTLNVKTLHLHQGTFLNQGTVKFKEEGRAYLYGHDLVNDHKISGVKNLTFSQGGLLDLRLSRSQITLKKGVFVYEGRKLNFHPHSSLSASSILMKTSDDLLSLPSLTGERLHLEAPSLEESLLKKTTPFKTLKLISTRSSLTFSAPFGGAGSLTLEAPQVTNKGGLGTKGDLHIKAPMILNEASLLSEQGKLVLEGNVQHTQGRLGAYKGVEITGEKHTLLGEIHPQTALVVKSRQGFTYDPLSLKTENVLKLIFQEPTLLPHKIDTPGLVVLEGPEVTLKASVQAQHLEARPSFLKIEAPSLSCSLKAWGQVEVVAPHFTAEQGIEVAKDLKITSAGSVVLKGPVVSQQNLTMIGSEIEAQQELFAHKTLSVESAGKMTFKERAVGIEGINLTVKDELHYKEADQNVTAENSSLQTKGILRIVSQHPVLHLKHSLHLLGMLDLHAPLIHNQASLRANEGIQMEAPLYPDRLSIHNDGGYLLSDQGNIVLKGRVCHNSGGLIRSSHKVVIDGTIHNLCSKIIGREGIKVNSQKVLNLVYQKDSFQTEGLLSLIFAEGGGNIDRPLETAGTLEIKLLPNDVVQYLNLYTNLKAGRGLRFEAPGHAIVVGEPSLPFVELHSGGFFEVPTAQFFDLAHGGIFSDHFFHIKTDNRILLGNWLEETRMTRVQRNSGDYLKIYHPYYTSNGSYCASNGGMKLETTNYSSNGGDILVMDKDLEIITQGYCYPISDLVEVWQGNASITADSFCQHMYNSAKCGDNISAPFWVNYMLPAARSPRLCVNGNIFFNVKKGESWSGSILASKTIFGKEFIQQKAYLFYFFSGLRQKSSNNAVSLVNTHTKYNQPPQLQGSKGIAFAGTKQALVQGRVVGPQVVIAFEDELTVQTVTSGQPLAAFQPVMDLGSLSQTSSLVKVDTTGKEPYLLSLAVPLKYPLEKELQEMDKLILGPLGSEKLRPFLHPLLEGRALLEALQQNIGYIPFSEESTDFLALHLQLRRNGAEVMKVLRPYLQQPSLLGLPENASPQALMAAGQSLLQGQHPSLSKELALKMSHPLVCDIPQVINNEKVLRSYLYTPHSYYNPKKCEHIAQLWAKELYLVGQEGSHLHLDRSRLMAERGKILAGTLSLEKEIQYNTQTQQYVSTPGGEIVGDTWEIHAEKVMSKLGMIDVKHLWLDVLTHYYTSGVTKADVLVCDVKQVTLDRKQRSWTVTYTVETTTKKNRTFRSSKKKTSTESHTVTLTESYPAHLSGLLAFEKFIGKEGDATAWFPERQGGREIETLSVQGGRVRAGKNGWAPQVQKKITFTPKEDRSLRSSETSCKGYKKKGMVEVSTVVSPEVLTEGPLHPVSQDDMPLVSLKVTSSSDHVVFEAKHDIHLQEHSVFNREDFHYFNRKNKIYELERWSEKRTPLCIDMPGKPIFKAGNEIWGEVTQIQRCQEPVYKAPRVNLSRPLLRYESHERLIGILSKGNAGLATVLALAAAIGSAGLATPAAMAAVFSEIGGVIASATIASIASQTASSLVMHQGNLKQVGKDLTSSRALKSYAIAGASAGLLHQLSGTLNLPTQPKGFEQHLKVSAVRAAVSTPLNIFIGGCNPGEAALNGLKCFAANSAGGFISENIGDAFDAKRINEITRYLAHGGGGAVTGAILSIGEKDILRRMSSAAVAAMTAEVASDLFSQGLKDQEQSLVAKAHREGRSLTLKEIKGFGQAVQVRADIAKVVGTACSLLVGRDVSTAFMAAHNAVEYNWAQHVLLTLAAADVMLELYTLTHPEEAEAFKQRAIQAVADKTGLPPEAIEQNLQGMLMAGSLVGGTGKFLKGLGTSLLKSEVGKRLRGLLKIGGESSQNLIKPPSGFTGHSGFELKNSTYQSIRNKPATINNISYSGHALDQMQNRGITPSIVKNAIKTGTTFSTKIGTIGFYDSLNNIRVIVNSETKVVVTVIRGKP